MTRQMLIGCLPFLALILVSMAALRALVWLSRAKFEPRRLRQLNADEVGAVQSLSFVLTVPLFIMIMMFIVQLSQLTIAKIVVEYSAFVAGRAAAVWAPANFGPGIERENQIGSWNPQGPKTDDNGVQFEEYQVNRGSPPSPKFSRIELAAALACVSISPSRDTGADKSHPGNGAATALKNAYAAISPASASNQKIPQRLEYKLAYALENTRVRMFVRHRSDEPMLGLNYELPPYNLPPYHEFDHSEMGWQDQLILTVEHDFALLPGPARILARRSDAAIGSDPQNYPGSDSVARRLKQNQQGIYTYPMSATVKIVNEGEKPVLPYTQRLGGQQASTGWPQVPSYQQSLPWRVHPHPLPTPNGMRK